MHGLSLVAHALVASAQCRGVTEVVVVGPPDHLDQVGDSLADTLGSLGDRVSVRVVAGGLNRSGSVARGLAGLSADVGIVLVHDAARAFAPVEVFDRVVTHVRAGHSAVIPVLPVVDTITSVDAQGRVAMSLSRSQLRVVQTPQGFLRETLEHAHGTPGGGGTSGEVTDDAGMVERVGGTVSTVAGDLASVKITTAHDLKIAEVISRAAVPQ